MTSRINDLYEEALRGNKPAKEELFEFLYASFRVFVRQKIVDADDREDVVQAAMAKIAAKIGSVQIAVSFAAWAHSVLKGEALEHYRRKSLTQRKLEEVSSEQDALSWPEEDSTLIGRIKDCLAKMNKVNRRYARILNLHYQGYTTQEVCRKLGVTRDNLYVVLSRARSMLRSCMDEGDITR
ncbi:MAG: sigma-70 family RNA polymerase sigma factor [Candidatus Zixiibacteriota bacterium]|nr:MAG: sigma-70 family RNA polymerase sigma factor [candidate division Zixibacteria bacterium]